MSSILLKNSANLKWTPFTPAPSGGPEASFEGNVLTTTLVKRTDFRLDLVYLSPGAKIPQHGENSWVSLHVVYGPGAKIGVTENQAQAVESGANKSYTSTYNKTYLVSYARTIFVP